jgi:thiamine transport system permease protein
MPPLPRFSDAALPPRPLRLIAGAAVAILIAILVAMVFAAILAAAAGAPAGGSSRVDIWHLVAMTAIQAGLSTILSLIAGVALAWALNRLPFPGRGLVVGLFSTAIVTPGILVAFGLLAVWGRSGWVSGLSQLIGGPVLQIPIFGLGGILAAHTILDGAFAARILLGRLDGLPDERLKLGQSLGLSALQRFRALDWPAIRGTLPGLAAIIFLLAFTSFPIVLLLGGGPANQTLEVAIYSAVRLDFDLPGAVLLALVQIGICGAIVLATAALAPVPIGIGASAAPRWRDRPGVRAMQWIVLGAGSIGFIAPLASILIGGFWTSIGEVASRASFWSALLTSLIVATLSAALCVGLALVVGGGRAATGSRLVRTAIGAPAYAYLAVPAVVLALGFFLAVRSIGIFPQTAAPVVVVLANALLSLPFALATLAPPLEAISRSRGRLIRSLGLSGWRQFVAVEWPLIARDVGLAVALAFCFSLGDLGVIALFGTESFTTLPLAMYRALGAYRNNDAAVIAALMLLLSTAAFVVLPPLFGRRAHADARAGAFRLSRRRRGIRVHHAGDGRRGDGDLRSQRGRQIHPARPDRGLSRRRVGPPRSRRPRPVAIAARATAGLDPVPVRDSVRAPFGPPQPRARLRRFRGAARPAGRGRPGAGGNRPARHRGAPRLKSVGRPEAARGAGPHAAARPAGAAPRRAVLGARRRHPRHGANAGRRADPPPRLAHHPRQPSRRRRGGAGCAKVSAGGRQAAGGVERFTSNISGPPGCDRFLGSPPP